MRYSSSILQAAVFAFAIAEPLQAKVSAPEIAHITEAIDPKSRTLLALERLPESLDDRDQFTWLASQLDLRALDKSHVGIMTTSVLRLEKAFRSTPGTFEMTKGGVMQTSLLSGIVLRIEELLLHDNRAFRKSRERTVMGSMGFTEHFQALSEWCRKSNVEIEASALIPQAIDSIATLTIPISMPIAKQAPEAKPTQAMLSEEPTSSTPWSIIVVLIVAAGALLWLLLKRRS